MTSHTTGQPRGKPGQRWTQADTDELLSRHAQGETLTSIAKAMNYTSSVIRGHADKLDLSWDRSKTEAATIAHMVVAKEQRQRIIAKLYQRAETRVDAMDQPGWKKLVKGVQGAEDKETLDFVPADDERNMSSAVLNYLAAAAKLEALDDDGGVQAARSMLGALAKAIGLPETSRDA